MPTRRVRNYPVPDGAGRMARLAKSSAGTMRCARCSSTARCTVGFIGLAEMPEGAHRRAPRRERARRRTSALRSSATCASRCDEESRSTGLNFTLLATPAEGLSGRFVKIDAQEIRHDPGRYRPRILHQQLPYPGVLSRSRAFDKITHRSALSRADQRADTSPMSSWTATHCRIWTPLKRSCAA